MRPTGTFKFAAVLLALVVLALGLAACNGGTTTTTTPSAPAYTINQRDMPDGMSDYLTDGSGRTLYYFTNDAEGMSNADAAIIANWPVFHAASISVPTALMASDFGTITRSDGAMQTTFMGWPLYYYAQDTAAGDMKGQAVNDKWFVVDPADFQPPRFFPLVHGWYKGMDVTYYDFGANTPITADGKVATDDIFAFITGMDADGNPQFVNGQHNVVDTIPGDPGYSDLWHVSLVTVPADYVADTIRTEPDLMAAGYPITRTDILVNCPIVPPGSTTETGRPLTQGWYNGRQVYYFDYGMNPDIKAPIFALITGMDADGNPMFVDGQRNIIDVTRGDEGYSDFWHVHLVTVPADYVANTFKSAADVMNSGYPVTETNILVNCPVVTN